MSPLRMVTARKLAIPPPTSSSELSFRVRRIADHRDLSQITLAFGWESGVPPYSLQSPPLARLSSTGNFNLTNMG